MSTANAVGLEESKTFQYGKELWFVPPNREGPRRGFCTRRAGNPENTLKPLSEDKFLAYQNFKHLQMTVSVLPH